MNKRKRYFLSLLMLILVIVAFALLTNSFERSTAESGLKIDFLNVGQGDAEYIRTPGGQDILIDGGPDNQILNELGKVMAFSDREINLVILSHPHADHLVGLIEVIKRYQVDEIWETGVTYPSATYDEFHRLIKEKNIPERLVKKGDSKQIDQVNFTVLAPLASYENKTIDNINNASIVNRLDYGQFSTLFMGDAEKEIQNQLLEANIHATVLKVAHHGSQNGVLLDFLKIARPAVAIISVGAKNRYGHPHAATLKALKDLVIKYYRTDQDGRIEITTSGDGYLVDTANN